MYELIFIEFKENYKLILSSFLMIICSVYLVKNNIVNYIIIFYLVLGVILDAESKSIKDRSLFYFNMFPNRRGYIIIEKIFFGFLLSVIFYLYTNLINYIFNLNLLKYYILVHLFNVILISGILSTKVEVHTLSICTNIITIVYGVITRVINTFISYHCIEFKFTPFLFFLLLSCILFYVIRKTDYAYDKSR